MALSRRAFLKTVGVAGMVATLDPVSKLWVPTAQARTVAGISLEGRSVQSVIDEQLELNDMAMQAAIALANLLERSQAIGLKEIVYRESGNLSVSTLATLTQLGLLTDQGDEEEGDLRIFTPDERRNMVYVSGTGKPHDLARQVYGQGLSNYTAFVPMSKGLRVGEAWGESDQMRVGLATEPESGVSVRILRWQHDFRRRRETRTGIEVAGGSFTRGDQWDEPERIPSRWNYRRLMSETLQDLKHEMAERKITRKDVLLGSSVYAPYAIPTHRFDLSEGDVDVEVNLLSNKREDA